MKAKQEGCKYLLGKITNVSKLKSMKVNVTKDVLIALDIAIKKAKQEFADDLEKELSKGVGNAIQVEIMSKRGYDRLKKKHLK